MHPSLEQLRRLQDLEQQAARLRADLDATDVRRQAIEAPVERAKTQVKVLEQSLDTRQSDRRAGDRDVAAAQQRLTRFKQQLMAVTNQREFEAVTHEIATVERELQTREDETIGLLLEIDDLTPQLEAARRALRDEEDAAGVALAGLADETSRHRLELAALEGDIASLRPTVDAAALAIYDRTSKRYPRYAVAELKGDLCVGCNVKLRTMLAGDVRRGEKIVQCENCTRLLFAIKPPPAPPAS